MGNSGQERTRPRSSFIELPRRRAAGGALRLPYLDWGGDGAPLVLLHGLASNARIWDLTAPHLVRHFRVIALDQRGHGLSDKSDSYTFQAVTGDVAALAERLGLDVPVLVGHSWGANVALQFAAEHPGVVRGLVLVDGGFLHRRMAEGMTWEKARQQMLPPDIDGMKVEDFLSAARSWPDVKDLWNEQIQEMLLANFEVTNGRISRHLPIPQHMQIARAIWDQQPSQLWPLVRCPVLMVAAVRHEDDPERGAMKEAVLRVAAAAKEAFPHAETLVMEDTIHDIPVQRPRELAEAIMGWAGQL